jgi:hypothetical protein
MNLTDKVFSLHYLKDKVEKFEGIKRSLPNGYQPKIKIQIIAV